MLLAITEAPTVGATASNVVPLSFLFGFVMVFWLGEL